MAIDLQPDLDGTRGALAFLQYWTDEPLIFASHTDPVTGEKGAFEARQFRKPFDWAQVRDWIASRQREGNWCNIYFSVNPALGSVNKKMARTDVASLVALQVDKDVDAGTDQAEGIANIVNVFQHAGKPPTDIVTSGGGAQAYWRLQQPIPVAGDAKLADDLALYSKQLAQELSGDSCWSLDHIMRVPGTVNIPNALKLKKGRKPRVATWHSSAAGTYDLGDFTKAAPEEIVKPKGFDAEGFELQPVRPDHEFFNGIDPKWMLIGEHGNPTEFGGDRSRMALAFVTALMRHKVDEQIIASVLMDPWWKVGECIRDKGNETKRHLRRIIERARKFVAQDDTKPAVISREKPTRTARQFLARVWPDLLHSNGEFLRFDKCRIPTEEDTVRSKLRGFMNSCLEYCGNDAAGKAILKPFDATNTDVNEALHALRDEVHVDRDEYEAPCWLVDKDLMPAADEIVNCQNGLLHVPTRKLLDHSPDYFNYNTTTYSYDPTVLCPVWHKVLEDYWPPKPDGTPADEVLLLQEMMGYSLLPWTSLQKLFAIVGPGRSGKGTIGRVLRMLVGEKNVGAPTLSSLARGEFGLQSLLHKTLAIVGEAAFSPRDDRAAVTNLLKTISGEDKIEVNRKNKDHWLGRLLIRFWLFCNKIPDFDDAGRAFMMRLIPLQMTISFAGKEDEALADKLEAEIAGIMNWVLEGFDRLVRNRGKFTMPESTLAMREVFGRLSNPLNAFIDDCIERDDTGHASEVDLYITYKRWCESVGQQHPQVKAKFIEGLVAMDPAHFKRLRPRTNADGHNYAVRPHAVAGLKLKRPAPKDEHSPSKGHVDQLIPF